MTFLAWVNLKDRETPTRKLPIDTVGLGLLVVWVGALQVMLDQGKDSDWFASTQIVILAIITVHRFLAFLIWELTAEKPDGGSFAVQTAQLRAGNLGLLFGLCRVLRQRAADATLAANPELATPRPGQGWWRRPPA